ncbi:hypothetical protein GCM10011613_18390 [Cellvibrio zantedeschiae]|uniref:Uncharacterized protein n=1 Tax=Cellvibrio zantedeschiae TaxID=1237077 RepID=A0ABQ3B1I7_9GAMM|nr:hypothetical protein [Cellvibrio zantedeschiae]GGY73544.1 hypothetical protein GCM10011613_18390 [Cellvibrio zantedeschiae]
MKSTSTTMRHPNKSIAPATTDKSLTKGFTELFHQRLDALNLIKQLNHMVKAVQRHRGMSMGLLGGNALFREEFTKLQRQIAERLELFSAFTARSHQLLPQRDQENLHSAWLTISHDWQEDSVIDNYELHCHLIEQLLALLASLAKQMEQPIAAILASNNEPTQIYATSAVYPNRFKQLEVLHFSTRLMPSVAEQIGRIRALATYTAALGYCDSDYASKLRYVIQCTRVNNEKLRHQSKRMESILEKDSPLLSQLKSYEIKLTFLLNMIEQDVLREGKIAADSNRLFELATDIIDMYLNSVDEGTALIERWHNDEIENWLMAIN